MNIYDLVIQFEQSHHHIVSGDSSLLAQHFSRVESQGILYYTCHLSHVPFANPLQEGDSVSYALDNGQAYLGIVERISHVTGKNPESAKTTAHLLIGNGSFLHVSSLVKVVKSSD